MVTCASCGTQGDGGKFCNQCGQQLIFKAGEAQANEHANLRAQFMQTIGDVKSNGTCAFCASRLPKNICGSSQSSRSNLAIKHTDSCESFSNNPAQEIYARALFKERFADKAGIDVHDLVHGFKEAISAGLPADDELDAQFRIAKNLVFWINEQQLEPLKIAKLAETEQAIDAFESALELDKRNAIGFFEEQSGRLFLSQLDMMYALMGSVLSIERGQGKYVSDEEAVGYWKEKLSLCDYLSSNPLIATLVQAGYAYSRLGKKDLATIAFRKAAEAAPVNISEKKEYEQEQQREARNALKELMGDTPSGRSDASATAQLSRDQSGTQSFEKRIQKKALASLLCGIFGLFFLGWLLGPIALVLGLQARSELSKAKTAGSGKAIAGVILGALATFLSVVYLFRRIL